MESDSHNIKDSIDQEIKDFFEGEMSMGKDISYHQWITKDDNLKYLCKVFNPVNNNDKAKTDRHHDYNCEFKLLNLITEDKEHRDLFAKNKKNNVKLDRHSDILPYQFNCVPLSKEEGQYINASFINGPLANDKDLFIATQGPLKQTIEHFWKMIIYNQSRVILMMANLLEEGGRAKSELYWPNDTFNPLQLSNGITITLINETILIEKGLIERVFHITTTNLRNEPNNEINETIEIKQYHVICWPDHMIPEDILVGLQVLQTVCGIVTNTRNQYPTSPIVIHCSAGAGRTGTFIAIYNIMRSIEHEQSHIKYYNVFNVVRKLREQRYKMVTVSEQYKYIYDFISEWFHTAYPKD